LIRKPSPFVRAIAGALLVSSSLSNSFAQPMSQPEPAPPDAGIILTPTMPVAEAGAVAPGDEAIDLDAGPALQATVTGDRSFSAASSRTVRDQDFLLRPMNSPEDIMRVVPGLVTAQHQGGGKADQLFLRGFDADHGTDVAVFIDGIPVNMPSHAHGQGYSDLHFIIPEAIERVDVTKGPYFAEYGDFDTAGAANLATRKEFDKSEVSLTYGSFTTWRVLGIATPSVGTTKPWFAVELYGTEGWFNSPEKLERFNFFGKNTWDFGKQGGEFSLLATAYASSWYGSGQIPARLVDAGFMDRFDSIDPTEGGSTHRLQIIAGYKLHPNPDESFSSTLSVVRYGLTIFNDFTFQLRDPINGDEIEQNDERVVLMGNLRYEKIMRDALPGTLIGSTGAQFRTDLIRTQLWHVRQRARLPDCFGVSGPCVDTDTQETSGSAWAQLDWRAPKWLRVVLGVRGDLFEFDVHSNKADGSIDGDHLLPIAPAASRSLLSPKASVVVTPFRELELFFNYGEGFHSNDARSVVENAGAGALPRAYGGEIGARARLCENKLELAASVWRIDLQDELVWNGDTGGTSENGPTTRHGIDLEGRWQILEWLYADGDATFSSSTYKQDSGNGNAVALAPPVTVTAGLSARHPSGFSGSLRMRHIGDRPGTQFTLGDGVPECTKELNASTPDGQRCYLTALGYTVFDAQVSYTAKRFSVAVVVENLTNSVFREAQFANVTQVIAPPAGHTVSSSGQPWGPGETHPITDLHYTPGAPIGARVAGTFYF